MWVLVRGKWYHIVALQQRDIRIVQQAYRANGMPIEAIARKKSKPPRDWEMPYELD